jgi:aspartyl-tRNA(Asn)/glutamyl-tRNA(Gln) amidotransferase subunit C
MSTLSRDEVAKLAGLARIEMTEEELVELSSQFGMILDAVARVQEVNLEGVKATSHPQPIENITRPDVVQPSLSPAEALSGAPAQEDQRFRVPQILGEE